MPPLGTVWTLLDRLDTESELKPNLSIYAATRDGLDTVGHLYLRLKSTLVEPR